MKYNYSSANFYYIEGKQHRDQLTRYWGDDHDLNDVFIFIGLNPSTADEKEDDATIRRLVQFAKDNGNNMLIVMNLFSIVNTDPKTLKKVSKKILDKSKNRNFESIIRCLDYYSTNRVVLGGGSMSNLYGRLDELLKILKEKRIKPYCYGTTKSNLPKHPLYLKKDTALKGYEKISNEEEMINKNHVYKSVPYVPIICIRCNKDLSQGGLYMGGGLNSDRIDTRYYSCKDCLSDYEKKWLDGRKWK